MWNQSLWYKGETGCNFCIWFKRKKKPIFDECSMFKHATTKIKTFLSLVRWTSMTQIHSRKTDNQPFSPKELSLTPSTHRTTNLWTSETQKLDNFFMLQGAYSYPHPHLWLFSYEFRTQTLFKISSKQKHELACRWHISQEKTRTNKISISGGMQTFWATFNWGKRNFPI